MHNYVVDTSFVLKWFIHDNEEDLLASKSFYKELLKGELKVYAPSFLQLELINVFVHTKKAKSSSMVKILITLDKLNIVFDHFSPEDFKKIAKISEQYKLTSYDSCYVYLSIKRNAPLVTYDKEILRSYKNAVKSSGLNS